jgi:hypothetical protein
MAIARRTKNLDVRHTTKGGGIIRIERWVDVRGADVNYNMAYCNRSIHGGDNGRVFGFDDAHWYRDFASRHHMHWFGVVYEVRHFVSFDFTLRRFDRMLRMLKYRYGRGY